MFVLYEFGRRIEIYYLDFFGLQMGRMMYVAMYLLTIIAGDIPTLIKHRDNPNYGSIGASGAVSGILFIYILIHPWHTLSLYVIIPIPAIIAGIGYLWYSSWSSKRGTDRIDHLAHFYGAWLGMLFTVAFKPSLILDFVESVSQVPWL